MSNAVLRPRHKPVTHLPISRFSLVRRQLTVRAAGIRVFGIGRDPLFEWQEGIKKNDKGSRTKVHSVDSGKLASSSEGVAEKTRSSLLLVVSSASSILSSLVLSSS